MPWSAVNTPGMRWKWGLPQHARNTHNRVFWSIHGWPVESTIKGELKSMKSWPMALVHRVANVEVPKLRFQANATRRAMPTQFSCAFHKIDTDCSRQPVGLVWCSCITSSSFGGSKLE
eukprot:3722272-Amphidinium_carterae.2